MLCAAFHPSGTLGRRLQVKVSDLMHTGDELPLAAGNPIMRDAIITMANKRFGCVGVVSSDEGN